jgi:hypothetical protein
VQMKRSIETYFIVSKNSIFSSLLAFCISPIQQGVDCYSVFHSFPCEKGRSRTWCSVSVGVWPLVILHIWSTHRSSTSLKWPRTSCHDRWLTSQTQECEGAGMVFYATWYVMYDDNTSTDTFTPHLRTKHSLLIFSVQETLHYLNVASKNKMSRFRKLGSNPRIYYKGEGGDFSQVQVVVSLVIHVCPWFVQAPKMFHLCTDQLVVWFCAGPCAWLIACHYS